MKHMIGEFLDLSPEVQRKAREEFRERIRQLWEYMEKQTKGPYKDYEYVAILYTDQNLENQMFILCPTRRVKPINHLIKRRINSYFLYVFAFIMKEIENMKKIEYDKIHEKITKSFLDREINVSRQKVTYNINILVNKYGILEEVYEERGNEIMRMLKRRKNVKFELRYGEPITTAEAKRIINEIWKAL